MKYFAITPDTTTPGSLKSFVPGLLKMGVRFLYLRSCTAAEHGFEVVSLCREADIVPIVPLRQYDACAGLPCGLHLRETDDHDAVPGNISPLVITASAHSRNQARRALQDFADYCFISPVFPPLSKPDDRRPPVPLDDIQELVDEFGDRTVLLGGMTSGKIREMQKKLTGDFSVAGISMFFPGEAMLS